jgi:hypothetical protein
MSGVNTPRPEVDSILGFTLPTAALFQEGVHILACPGQEIKIGE